MSCVASCGPPPILGALGQGVAWPASDIYALLLCLAIQSALTSCRLWETFSRWATRCQAPCTQHPAHLPYPTLPSPCRFMGIAEQMGRVLQRTSISVNIKERLDFSCALFDSEGERTASRRPWPLPCSKACPERILTASNTVFTGVPAPQLQPILLSPLSFACCRWADCQWAARCPPLTCRQPGFQCAPPARPSGRHERGSQVPDPALCRRRRRCCRGAAGAMGLQECLVC